ncbi:1-phosphatidylinositol 4,5-bisphosphate phosphodiesterase delta-4 [Galendromus occidentalis]|uniref:Phosphoinositide phospholipase C n=1 Tax=Galendromus occidentalis TaxID=34638 RepID=A0AAJ7P9L2_9ACAR|nr:1-phosphatidylinositol 4,5-bisphosphate phosphodiesterase delta-4 [Galendromus occidentalis]
MSESAEFAELLAALENGTVLRKVISPSKIVSRRFFLDPKHEYLAYFPSRKGVFCSADAPLYAIRDISEVRRGFSTDTFHRLDENSQQRRSIRNGLIRDELCFSVVLNTSNTTLDLIARTKETADAWQRVLSHLVAAYRSAERQEAFDSWIKAQFARADVNGNGVLNFPECVELLKQMNKAAPKKVIRKLFEAANKNRLPIDGEDVLDKNEFVLFYNSLLNRPEIVEIFDKYKAKGTELMGAEELQRFLRREQSEQCSVNECQQIIQTLSESTHEDWGSDGHLTVRGFEAFLLSDRQDIFDHRHHSVCQDMTRPLNEYFIASSHNTYLLNHQLVGASSVEGYIKAMKRGCRCLELDVWDGQNSEPVVFHGYTLTTKILLKDVLEAISTYAFQSSPYPVILSIENHCTQEQQRKMASYFRSYLGEYYCGDLVDDLSELPSPEQLKYKILIKCKKLETTKELPELREEQEFAQTLSVNDAEALGYVSDSSEVSEHFGSGSSNEGDDGKKDADVSYEKVVASSSREVKGEHKEKNSRLRRSLRRSSGRGKLNLTQELSDCVNYIIATPFHSLEETQTWRPNQMTSFSESKCLKMLNGGERKNFMKYTQKHLARIYPKGSRTSSTNYNPIPFFNSGCQIVALNYQTPDSSMFYNIAKFAQNGNCGYVLKPRILRNDLDSFDFDEPPLSLCRTVTIKIISGQHIPKPDESLEGEVVDPYVLVKIVGHPKDRACAETEFVRNNGFNPNWNRTFEFIVEVPDLAFLVFIVKDDSRTGKNLKLGKYAVPLTAVRTGYRHVHLRNPWFEKIVPASLFVHIDIRRSSNYQTL